MRKNLPVTNNERSFGEDITIISTTDTKGIITYVNQEFIEISGFTEEELIGQNHNIVRHPDMPPAAFKDLWDTVKSGRSWRGIVKNRCKNGDYYWADAYVTPVYENGQLVGYQSVRTKPTREQIKNAQRLYGRLNAGRQPSGIRLPQLGLKSSLAGGLGVMLLFVLLSGTIGYVSLARQVTTLEQYVASMAAVEGAATERDLIGSGSGRYADLRREVVTAQRNTAIVLGAIGGVALLVSIALMVLMQRKFIGPLQKAADIAKAIAGGDLVPYSLNTGTDEIGQVLQAIKMMQARLRTVIGRIAASVQAVATAATQMTAVAEQARQGMERQQAETALVATAMNEMAATSTEVAKSAEHTAQAIHDADREAIQGKQVVQETVASIHGLAQEISQGEGVIRKLESNSGNIGTVIDVIRGIAEQTNLLALNAAIEAARAGDQGRGFAVVADEVRKLAMRTQDSTSQIQKLIEDLQNDANDAVEAMKGWQERAKESVDRAARAGDSLDAITSAVARITEMSTQIAHAAEQQSAVATEIDRNLVNINAVACEAARGAEETAATSAALSAMVTKLQTVVGQFRLRRA